VNRKIRGAIIGAIIGAIVGAGLVSICGWSTTVTVIIAIIGAIAGGIIGLFIVFGVIQREKDIETGLGS